MSIFLGPLFAFFGALLGGVITFTVTLIQMKSNRKNLKNQIDSELEKIKLQYNLEQRRDDRNFLYKLKLEKSSQLADDLVDYIRQIMISFNYIMDYISKEKDFLELNDDDRLLKLRKLENENQDLIRIKGKELMVLVRYLPENRNSYNHIIDKYNDFSDFLIDNYTSSGKTITDDQKKIEDFRNLYYDLSECLILFQEEVSKNMEKILIDLERKDL